MELQPKVELLSVNLLNQNRSLVDELKQLADGLNLELGWHFLLDLAWILSHLQPVQGMKVLDAGAGTGLMQWYLAGKRVDVLSVDPADRGDLPLSLRAHYKVTGLREHDLRPPVEVLSHNFANTSSFLGKGKAVVRDSGWTLAGGFTKKPDGKVVIYNQNLDNLTDIQDGSIDAVVSISALEHLPKEKLAVVVDELMRVLKPGGMMLATLGAAKDQDWFHEPSHGWCYTIPSLQQIFKVPADSLSNQNQFDQLLAMLTDCEELRNNLASFYFRSGNNGMPWGNWDPKYQPVGVCQLKAKG